MRALLVLIAALALAGTADAQSPNPSAGAAHSTPLTGTWEMVSARYTAPDGQVRESDASALRSVKVLNGTHFMFITLDKDGKVVRAGGGPYRVEGNTYTETLDHGSFKLPDGSASFAFRLEGDTWYHSGTINGVKLEEVWRRRK